MSPTKALAKATLLVSGGAPGTEDGSVPGGAADGARGDSYGAVRESFQPLLERRGEVVNLARPESQLEFALLRARREGRSGLHLCFGPFTEAYLTHEAPNVVFPAWAFPDVPASDFKQNPRFNWVRIANHCSLVVAHNEFTAGNLGRAGVRAPIRVVPVPIRDGYFRTPDWDPSSSTTLDCAVFVLNRAEVPPLEATDHEDRPGAVTLGFRIRMGAWRAWRACLKPWLPVRLANVFGAAVHAAVNDPRPLAIELPPASAQLELTGVVYTTILDPDDECSNWRDLLTAFLFAVGDRGDATLVMRLVTGQTRAVREVLDFYEMLGVSHRCRVAIIQGSLSDEQALRLARASAFYLNASRAEAVCLPVPDFLAAGRPAIAPRHTALADYFDDRLGFVVESHPEPCPWPFDDSGRIGTSWHRIVWSSLRDQIADAYRVARGEPAAYAALAAQGRARMQSWASREAVEVRLAAALDALGVSPPAGASLVGPHRRLQARPIAAPWQGSDG